MQANMLNWGYIEGASECECGQAPQIIDHLLSCDLVHGMCTIKDPTEAYDVALRFARHWQKVVW